MRDVLEGCVESHAGGAPFAATAIFSQSEMAALEYLGPGLLTLPVGSLVAG